MSILFRWAVWGDKTSVREILPCSIGSFRRAFGAEARYVVCTDEPGEMRSLVNNAAEIIPFTTEATFNISYTTWRKWCPSPRLAPDCAEVSVDTDVFLVGDPNELWRFALATTGAPFLIMQEAPGSRHYIGGFGERVFKGIPPVNTGLFGQRAGADLSKELVLELEWWLKNVPHEKRRYHDDQGAIVAVLSRYYLIGQVELLPQDRYCVMTRRCNSDRATLDGVVAIHANAPGKYAFHKFRTEIEAATLREGRVD